MGLKEAFLKKATQRELVSFDAGLDEPVFIVSMRSSTASKLEAILTTDTKTAKDLSDARWMVIRECVVDSDGVTLFSSADRAEFDKWSRSFYEPIFDKCLEVSGVTKKEQEQLGLNDEDEGSEKN